MKKKQNTTSKWPARDHKALEEVYRVLGFQKARLYPSLTSAALRRAPASSIRLHSGRVEMSPHRQASNRLSTDPGNSTPASAPPRCCLHYLGRNRTALCLVHIKQGRRQCGPGATWHQLHESSSQAAGSPGRLGPLAAKDPSEGTAEVLVEDGVDDRV